MAPALAPPGGWPGLSCGAAPGGRGARGGRWLRSVLAGTLAVVSAYLGLAALRLPGQPAAFVAGASAAQGTGRPGARGARDASRVVRGVSMPYHNRDPFGIRHKESKKQAMRSSALIMHLRTLFSDNSIENVVVGDTELASKVIIDDVIVPRNLHCAYVHVSADGDELERRQVFVWVSRNAARISRALNKAGRYDNRGFQPELIFVESHQKKWEDYYAMGRENPEFNLPDPWAPIEDDLKKRHLLRDETWAKWGVGDAERSMPRRGFEPERMKKVLERGELKTLRISERLQHRAWKKPNGYLEEKRGKSFFPSDATRKVWDNF